MRLDLTAPHQQYRAKDGTRLPGVTTILGTLAKPALLGWYAATERENVVQYLRSGRPLPTRKDGKPLPFAEMKRDKAADLGTVTHFRCSCWLTGEEAEGAGLAPDLWTESTHGLDRFTSWWTEQGFTLLESEKVLVYESGSIRYGGTADITATDKSLRKVLVDLKTSKASSGWPYDETFGQVAAYAMAEELVSGVPVDRIIVARIGKTPGDELQTVELTREQFECGMKLFTGAYIAHEAKRSLDKLRK